MATVYKKEIRLITKKFAIRIIKFVQYLKKNKVEYVLRDQLLRSGTSIGANVKEAKSSSSRKEYIRFYEIALRSANETEYWTEIIEEVYDLKKQMASLMEDLREIQRIIGAIVVKLRNLETNKSTNKELENTNIEI